MELALIISIGTLAYLFIGCIVAGITAKITEDSEPIGIGIIFWPFLLLLGIGIIVIWPFIKLAEYIADL